MSEIVTSPIEYVLGFCFNEEKTSVVLIRKNKPTWQAGLLNGVGGKIECGESAFEAMVREFKEEVGVKTSTIDWKLFCNLRGKDFTVYCFKCFNSEAWSKASQQEVEYVEKHFVQQVYRPYCISNVPWLIEMAIDENYGKDFVANVGIKIYEKSNCIWR